MTSSDSTIGRAPDEAMAVELKEILEEDESRLGQVYRLSEEGKSPESISNELGVDTYGFVYSYLSIARALLNGEIATAPTVARRNASRLRSILKRDDLSVSAREMLEHNLALLNSVANDDSASEKEISEAKQGSRNLEEQLSSGTLSGIYVYSFPNLITHPRNENTGQTLFKIGRSADVQGRVFQQAKTAWPENPIILRVYQPRDKSADIASIEKRLHYVLAAASHGWDEGGKEWFLTSLEFLDEIANLLELSILANKDFGAKV